MARAVETPHRFRMNMNLGGGHHPGNEFYYCMTQIDHPKICDLIGTTFFYGPRHNLQR
jgi:hypothetical protein